MEGPVWGAATKTPETLVAVRGAALLSLATVAQTRQMIAARSTWYPEAHSRWVATLRLTRPSDPSMA